MDNPLGLFYCLVILKKAFKLLNFFPQDQVEKQEETIPFQTTSKFVFTDVEPTDEGEYGCLAVNEYGSDQVFFDNFFPCLMQRCPTHSPFKCGEWL